MGNRKSKMKTYWFVICFLLVAASGLEEGDECITPEGVGTCRRIWDCLSADSDNEMPLEMCSGENGIVCCLYPQDKNTTILSRSLLRESIMEPPVTPRNTCSSIPNNVTEPMRISLKKCLEYQEKLVYPCRESQNPNEGMIRENRCNWKPDSLIIGGVNSYRGEFPHMVHLGYGNETKWECGGVLLSEKFVLTAGHCSKDRNFGPVNKIRISFFKISEKITDVNLYNVKKIYKHPQYNSPFVYHDIALLESDRPMQLGQFAVPACLHDGRPINDTEVYAIGWGSTMFPFITLPDVLQKVVLEKYSDDYCRLRYEIFKMRRMPEGYDNTTQVCYGHRKISRDSCKGDSGGPLQVIHPEIKCMYLVTGVVSTSKWCAKTAVPGINTRVAPYLSWIESIVWP